MSMFNFDEYREEASKEKEYIQGEYPNLRVEVIGVKEVLDKANKSGVISPYTNMLFKVVDGPKKGFLISENIYKKAIFRMVWLATSCGLVQLDDQNKKVLSVLFQDPINLLKKRCYISTIYSTYGGKKRTKIDKMSSEPLDGSAPPVAIVDGSTVTTVANAETQTASVPY